ncbi:MULTISPECIES: carboxymuconolactone decarboxylase family protein [Sphingomonadaceae]|jgi:4-carboxymuconolactone decarboxylase|uniref:carboxymuconolactone decarboxylase family protein n=1 Tax=Sphingomonadales TaxID=204457 RepID=UPI000A037B23|nr:MULTISPECIES: carboxymuconolactone decarboxylase family protein [Sphingomonadaceae]MCC4257982.1 carboxymuconolactone decarboxylase family protein [Sphingobium lactosutens]
MNRLHDGNTNNELDLSQGNDDQIGAFQSIAQLAQRRCHGGSVSNSERQETPAEASALAESQVETSHLTRRTALGSLGVLAVGSSALASTATAQTGDNPVPQAGAVRDRYAIGLERLSAIDGRDGHAVVESLKEISPDFARYLIEFPFGDIYARPGLDLRQREIATIAALTALGNARPQLEVHIAAGLNVGLSQQEIIEIVMQMAVYAGFPAAINGLNAAKTVFDRHPTS